MKKAYVQINLFQRQWRNMEQHFLKNIDYLKAIPLETLAEYQKIHNKNSLLVSI